MRIRPVLAVELVHRPDARQVTSRRVSLTPGTTTRSPPAPCLWPLGLGSPRDRGRGPRSIILGRGGSVGRGQCATDRRRVEIARRAAATGARTEIVGVAPAGPAGDRQLVELAAAGVGHATVTRSARPASSPPTSTSRSATCPTCARSCSSHPRRRSSRPRSPPRAGPARRWWSSVPSTRRRSDAGRGHVVHPRRRQSRPRPARSSDRPRPARPRSRRRVRGPRGGPRRAPRCRRRSSRRVGSTLASLALDPA